MNVNPDDPSAGISPNPSVAAARSDRDSDRLLRSLLGNGRTQLSADAARRVRDASCPRDADLDRAERELVIVQRGYVPPAAND